MTKEKINKLVPSEDNKEWIYLEKNQAHVLSLCELKVFIMRKMSVNKLLHLINKSQMIKYHHFAIFKKFQNLGNKHQWLKTPQKKRQDTKCPVVK